MAVTVIDSRELLWGEGIEEISLNAGERYFSLHSQEELERLQGACSYEFSYTSGEFIPGKVEFTIPAVFIYREEDLDELERIIALSAYKP